MTTGGRRPARYLLRNCTVSASVIDVKLKRSQKCRFDIPVRMASKP
jgi:hypothetical protein